MASSAGDITSAMDNLNTFTTTLAENTGRLESMLANIDTFSSSLANADIVNQLNNTVKSLNEVLNSIESGEGSVGKLLTDDELYNSLNSAGENLSLLLEDLKAHPMRYVHFSLFGQSEAKVAKKEAKEAEKEKRKAAKESAK
jgi:phospholipid/cholesterol/gamma-HCH transport system substrate-binding protein